MTTSYIGHLAQIAALVSAPLAVVLDQKGAVGQHQASLGTVRGRREGGSALDVAICREQASEWICASHTLAPPLPEGP